MAEPLEPIDTADVDHSDQHTTIANENAPEEQERAHEHSSSQRSSEIRQDESAADDPIEVAADTKPTAEDLNEEAASADQATPAEENNDSATAGSAGRPMTTPSATSASIDATAAAAADASTPVPASVAPSADASRRSSSIAAAGPLSIIVHPPMCTHCESHLCAVSCAACALTLCHACDDEVHQHRAKRDHVRRPYGDETASQPDDGETNTEPEATDTDIDTARDVNEPEDATALENEAEAEAEATEHSDPVDVTPDAEDTPREASVRSPSVSVSREASTLEADPEPDAVASPTPSETPAPDEADESTESTDAPLDANNASDAPIAVVDPAPLPMERATPRIPAAVVVVTTDFCDHCQSHLAQVFCDACNLCLCAPECDEEVHSVRDKSSHVRVAYPPPPPAEVEQMPEAAEPAAASDEDATDAHNVLCDSCAGFIAAVYCDECKMHLCAPHCDEERHARGARVGHVRTPIGEAASITPAALASSPASRASTPPPDDSEPPTSRTRDDGLPPLQADGKHVLNAAPGHAHAKSVGLPAAAGASSNADPNDATPTSPLSATLPRTISNTTATGSRRAKKGTSGGGSTATVREPTLGRTRSSGNALRPATGPTGTESRVKPTRSRASDADSDSLTVVLPTTSAAGVGTSLLSPSPLVSGGVTPGVGSSGGPDREKVAVFTPSGNADKDKMNYNYVLYSLRNKVTKLEEQVEEQVARAQRAEDLTKQTHEAYRGEHQRRKEAEAALARERTEVASLQAALRVVESEREEARARLEHKQQEVDEVSAARAGERAKLHETVIALEKQVLTHSTTTTERTAEVASLKTELSTATAKVADLGTALRKERDLTQTYRAYSGQYEALILTLREKLAESERRHVAMAKWKAKASQYAEEWDLERKKLKRKVQKLSELLDTARQDLKDYRAILKFVAVRAYVNQWLLRRALKQVFVHAADLATTALIEQTEASPKVHNSVQLDTPEDLSVRNSRLLNEYPWGGHRVNAAARSPSNAASRGASGDAASGGLGFGTLHRFPPVVVLVKSITDQLHVAAEAGTLIRAQKRKWQETADAFFQRNVELTNAYLLSDAELLTTKKKSAALRMHTRALQTRHRELEVALDQALGERERVAQEMDGLERAARVEKTAASGAHAKRFERSVALTRRCLALETELRQLTAQRARLDKDVADAAADKRLLATAAVVQAEATSAEVAVQAAQQSHLLGWAARAEIGISAPTRGMVTSKPPRRATSPARHVSQTVHPVITPAPPTDAFEQKTPAFHGPAAAVIRRTNHSAPAQGQNQAPATAPPPPPDFNYAYVPPQTAPAAWPAGAPTFYYPANSAGAPVLARSSGRPVSSPTPGPVSTTSAASSSGSAEPGAALTPGSTPASAFAFAQASLAHRPITPAPRYASLGSAASAPIGSASTPSPSSSAFFASQPPPSQSLLSAHPINHTPVLPHAFEPVLPYPYGQPLAQDPFPTGAPLAFLPTMPAIGGATAPAKRPYIMPLAPAARSRPSSSPSRAASPSGRAASRESRSHAQRAAALNRSIVDAALARAARRGANTAGAGLAMYGRRATALRAQTARRPPGPPTATAEAAARRFASPSPQRPASSPGLAPGAVDAAAPAPPPVTSLKDMMQQPTPATENDAAASIAADSDNEYESDPDESSPTAEAKSDSPESQPSAAEPAPSSYDADEADDAYEESQLPPTVDEEAEYNDEEYAGAGEDA